MKKLLALVLTSLALFQAVAKGSPKVSMELPGGKTKSYKSISAALSAIGKKEGDFKIKLPAGTYEEVLYYTGPANIIISGEGTQKFGADVVVKAANSGNILAAKKGSSGMRQRCLFQYEGTGNLTLENLTLHNTFERGSVKGNDTQAEALGFDSTGNFAAYNCSFKSHQDTIRTSGKAWFCSCYIEGDTDFLWMVASGTVALYEDCDIVSVFDKNASNHTSYVCAPQMTIGNKAGKGLVIMDSRISSQDGQTTYLARTPWSNGYYNQVAVIRTNLEDVDEAWYKTPLDAEGIPHSIIGWKIDSASSDGLDVEKSDIVSESDAKTEFGGRRAVLNRYFDIASMKYRKDADSYWDTDTLIAERGWKTPADTSLALLENEKESVRTTYILDGKHEYAELKLDGFSGEKKKSHLVGKAGSSISFPVKGKSLVTVTGYYAGSGTIEAGKQGSAILNVATGSTSTQKEATYIVYEGATDVKITALDKMYVLRIDVDSDDTLDFVPVRSISVSSEDDVQSIKGNKQLKFSAKLSPARPTNNGVLWSVSDENAATIDSDGLLRAKDVSEDVEILVRAKARDENAVLGEIKIKIEKRDPTAFGLSYLDSQAATSSLLGTSDNEAVVKAGKAITSKGSWVYNSSKIPPALAKGALTYTGYSSPISGNDKVYIDFPLTAQETVEINEIEIAFGNHGTGNIAALINLVDGKKVEEFIDDTSRKVRTEKKVYEIDDCVVEKGKTVLIRVALYGYNGDEIDIPTGKAPTIGTITISGKQKK